MYYIYSMGHILKSARSAKKDFRRGELTLSAIATFAFLFLFFSFANAQTGIKPIASTTQTNGVYSINATLTVSGSVWNDANGDAINDNGETYYTGSTPLYATLVNASGNIVVSVQVNASGNYSLTGLPSSTSGYSVRLSTNQGTAGQSSSTLLLTVPAGWLRTGENNAGTTETGVNADGIITLPSSTSNLSNRNFGITQAGYIYVHKKTLDEASSVDFTFSVSGGYSTINNFNLNDNPSGYVAIKDIGSSQNGRLWAIGNSNNTLYYRDPGSTTWITTSITNASRVDGGPANIAYVVTTGGLVISFDGATSTSLSTSTLNYGSSKASDIGSAWDSKPYITTAAGLLWQYSGTGTTWTKVGTTTDNVYVDGNPATGDAIVAKNEWHIWDITPAGVQTSLGRPASSNAANAYDVAVDASGNIFSLYKGPSTLNGSAGLYPFIYSAGTWSNDEFTARSTASVTSGAITAGIGQEAWVIYNDGQTGYGTIYTRTFNGTDILWYDNEWLRTSSSNTNAVMLPVIPGTYTLTETLPSGWDLDTIAIYDPTNNSSGSASTQTSTLNVAAGEVVNVAYTNQFLNTTTAGTSCSLIFQQNFGSGTSATGPTLTGLTDYHYLASTYVLDGYYTLIKTTSGTSWVNTTLTDHTGIANGYFMAVNASYGADEFFRQRIAGLVVGASYTLSFWAADLTPTATLHPSVTMGTGDINTGLTIGAINTGSITSSSWVQYSFTFTASNSTMDIFLRNNAQGGSGNDVAIDDIALSTNPPSSPVTTIVDASCSSQGSVTVTSPLGSQYEYSIDGTSYQSSVYFTNLAPGLHTVYARFAGMSCFSALLDTVRAGVCGSVFDDENGLSDNTINGAGTNVSGALNAVLWDITSGQVADVMSVAQDGTYTLYGLTNGDNYKVEITTANPATGSTTLPAAVLPSGWINIGENLGNGPGNDGTADGILLIGALSSSVNYANFGIASYSVLPITLVSFDATAIQQTIQLNWQIATAPGATNFEVWRSNDGTYWSAIGKVITNSYEADNSYDFTDTDPVNGVNFYRLRIYYDDGSFRESNTVSVRIKISGNQIFIGPDPATTQLQIRNMTGISLIKIYDTRGKLMLSQTTDNAAATTLNISRFGPGIYYIAFFNMNGKIVKQTKFLRMYK